MVDVLHLERNPFSVEYIVGAIDRAWIALVTNGTEDGRPAHQSNQIPTACATNNYLGAEESLQACDSSPQFSTKNLRRFGQRVEDEQ